MDYSIGASQIPYIVYGSQSDKHKIWREIMYGESDISQSSVTGILVEPALVTIVEAITGLNAIERNKSRFGEYKGMPVRATPDAVLSDGTLLECKYYQTYNDKHYTYHELQCQVQMYVWSAPKAILFVLSGNTINMYDVQRRLIHAELEIVHQWYREHILSCKEPSPSLPSHAIQTDYNDVVLATVEIERMVSQYTKLRQMAKFFEEKAEAIKQSIVAFLHENNAKIVIGSNGQTIVSVRNDGKVIIG